MSPGKKRKKHIKEESDEVEEIVQVKKKKLDGVAGESGSSGCSDSRAEKATGAALSQCGKISMTQTVLKMMHCYGDGSSIRGNYQNNESGRLVEKFVLVDTVNILKRASDAASSSGCVRVSFDDLTAAICDNEDKMYWLINFARFMDLRQFAGIEGNDEHQTLFKSGKGNSGLVDSLREWLEKLGKTELWQYVDSEQVLVTSGGSRRGNSTHPVKLRHLERFDMLSKVMNEYELKEFHMDRRISFTHCCESDGSGGGKEVFSAWLESGASHLGLHLLPYTGMVLDVLAYLAKATVASVVDSVITLRDKKRRATASSSSPFLSKFQRLLDEKGTTTEAAATTINTSPEPSVEDVECALFKSHSILPKEVMEVLNSGMVKASVKYCHPPSTAKQ